MDIWNKSREPKESVSYMVEEITRRRRRNILPASWKRNAAVRR